MKFSKLKNQGQFVLNEAIPDLMVAFLGQNSNFEKKCVGPNNSTAGHPWYCLLFYFKSGF